MGITKNDVVDVTLATAKGIVGATPVVGSLLSEYISLAQDKVADKRMAEWKSMVEDQLSKLSADLNEIAESEFFYSCVQIATTNAMKSHQTEKRQLFANALFHSATLDLDQDKKLLFLSLLNQYTLTGILLLKYYSEDHYHEEDYVHRGGMVTTYSIGGTEHPIKSILEGNPQLEGDSEYATILSNQMANDSLISPIDFRMPVSAKEARNKRTTKLGDEFLNFIICES